MIPLPRIVDSCSDARQPRPLSKQKIVNDRVQALTANLIG